MKKKLVRITYCYECGIRRSFLEPNSKCPKSWNGIHHWGSKYREKRGTTVLKFGRLTAMENLEWKQIQAAHAAQSIIEAKEQ